MNDDRQKQIGASAFMTKRGQGSEPDDIPEAEQLELVDPISIRLT
ncbi:hypothetical protein [Candidatus Thiodictyon syntrophicum]|jgi:hypothetical protein|nr:hypothetical protein [Candidatus Thiodictyon syntrophicum]